MLIEIKHRFADAVLFTLQTQSLKLCAEAAIESHTDLSDANLSDADLSGAYLGDAYLGDADLRYANLRGAYLRDANLRGANLRGAKGLPPEVTNDQAIRNLDVVAEIILTNPRRLNMADWHGNSEWQDRTCAEESVCGTTHCLGGWLQVCCTDPVMRALPAYLAGSLLAPVAAEMFYSDGATVLRWLKNREYAKAQE